MEKFAVLGLGYVGLPLAIRLSKKYEILAYDNNQYRIECLKKGYDYNKEFSKKELINKKNLTFSDDHKNLRDCKIYFLTIPTPINKSKLPDLKLLKKATSIVGKYLKIGDIVVYESTVYPGATEEVCVPILEKKSNLKFNKDFYCSYSPERINPGDKKNNIKNISKLVSSSSKNSLKKITKVYQSIINAKIFQCSSIKVAEAAKVIENTQRDLNISLMNEYNIICRKIGIDIYDVLNAAATKWNFLNFKPGLVGGHCIGVDPYYLTYKAKKIGLHPRVVLAGRKVNDDMPFYYGRYFLKNLKKKVKKKIPKILILGATFKENISDTRNSKILMFGDYLVKNNCNVEFFDPHVISKLNKNINLVKIPRIKFYDGIVIGVKHNLFKKMSIKKIKSFGKRPDTLIFDLQNIFKKKISNKLSV